LDIQYFLRAALIGRMNKSGQPRNGRQPQRFGNATDQMERYFAEHPRSLSAVRRPQLFHHDRTFALLGRNLQTGIAGLGNTVEAGLRACDLQLFTRAWTASREDQRQ
jgi:hypothetical protein